ncbi:MAG TPA: HEAT repeat domain-containing protein [Gemmatimonadaceae bacterium]|nr:HEAT repeat domain-containing protein [Gemmatimonadaceae bacterium]
MIRLSRLAAFIALVFGATLQAQDIARRVSAVREGTVELHFASRSGVCGDGAQSLSIGGSMHVGRYDADGTWGCEPGPVRVRLEVDDGVVREIRTSVGRLRRPANVEGWTDLGAVPAAQAAAWLLGLAKSADSHVSNAAITPVILADSVYPWRELLAIARDTATRSRGTRSSAAMWLSRFAAARMSGHENDLSAPDDEPRSDESEARSSAVFALSQLRNHEGVAPLIQVAQTNRDPRVRRSALFWLGQSGDPRALELFERILGPR